MRYLVLAFMCFPLFVEAQPLSGECIAKESSIRFSIENRIKVGRSVSVNDYTYRIGYTFEVCIHDQGGLYNNAEQYGVSDSSNLSLDTIWSYWHESFVSLYPKDEDPKDGFTKMFQRFALRIPLEEGINLSIGEVDRYH